MKQNRREALTALLGGMAGAACRAEAPRIQPMKEIPAASRVTAAEEHGWYLSVAGIAEAKGNLIVTYRRSDAHRASDSYIMTARSEDGGRTWKDHRPIHHLSWENNRACWVAPQLTALRDGRLVLVADRGEKLNKDDWPMLSRWQQKPLGMSNHLFWSHDGGQSWDGPHQIDDWGGEPGYILELADGTLVYTRTEAQRTEKLLNPLPQWGEFYYRNTAVFSDDGGKTWKRTAVVADDPYYSDCEVGLAEYAPGKLLAATRCGDAGSQFGQPSRLVYSSDSGRTWGKPKLAPFYGHRVIVGKLQSGKLLAVFRNAWGTSASYAFVFDAEENFDYQPNSWIWDEARCRLRDGAMELDTADGPRGAAEFTLYPCESLRSPVEIEAELAVGEGGAEACQISAGCWVRFRPDRVELADRPEQGFAMDATRFHRYRLVREGGKLTILADGETKLEAPAEGIAVRHVRFGNRYSARGPGAGRERTNGGKSWWRALSARVRNPNDHAIEWSWRAARGFPDQFRRDRLVLLERNGSFSHGNNGYPDWIQQGDGTILVADYTSCEPPRERPVLRVYRVTEEEVRA